MVLKADYKLDKSTYRTLVMTTGNPVIWSPVEEYIQYSIDELLQRLGMCALDEVLGLQGQIKSLRDILRLKEKVASSLRNQ